jgi:hypothetical protein
VRVDHRSRTLHDGAFLFVLGAVAIYGLHDSFLGPSYLIAGAIGLAIGMGLSVLVRRLRQPLIVLAGLLVAAFFILGGVVALHNLGGTALLPVPNTLSILAQTVVYGWKDMLTTLPPVDNDALLTLPYMLGLATGAIGMVVTDRSSWAPAPTLVVGALLAVVILMGVQHPSDTKLVGGVFAGCALAWLLVRVQRGRPHYISGGSPRITRRVAGTVLCGGATVLGTLLGTHLPGVGSNRTVLRTSVIPPFNVSQYASPLASFRRFTRDYTALQPHDGLYNTQLFKVSGLRAGTLIRIATLDSYDGNVWGAGDVAGSAGYTAPATADTYQKVGEVIDNPERGRPVQATVKILNNALGVWVPNAGGLTGITFANPTEQSASNEFRYNLATSTGVMPQSLQPGDTYTFEAVLPNNVLTAKTVLAAGGLPEVSSYTQFQQIATRWVGHATSGLQEIDSVASYLRANGHYTDGGAGFQSFAAGQSLYRLTQFTSTSGELAGDDEQFAALMALMANELGVPARVVLGAQVPANGVVTGADMHAWVELQAADGSWKTLPQTAFMGTLPPKKQSQKSQPSVPTSSIPPPAPVQPPATAGESLSNTIFHRTQGSKVTHPVPKVLVDIVLYLAAPVGLFVLVCAVILGLKAGRRARRRRNASPTRRLALAWRDVLDHAHDFGRVAPSMATRREQAAALGFASAGVSAARLDALMFGQDAPSADSAAAYWHHADQLRRELAGSHGRWRRLRAALSLSTFRPRRGHRQ